MSHRQISCAVLAGGESRRMGTNKALIDFGGCALVARIVDRLSAISDDVFVVAKQALDIDARMILEGAEPQTPLLGVLSALRAARHPLVFICGCDMPFVSTTLATFLAGRADGVDAVVPFRDGKSEALHCVWTASAAETVATMLDEGEYGLRRALARMNVDIVDEDTWRAIDPEGRAFTNLNSPEDLAASRSAPIEPQPSSDPR